MLTLQGPRGPSRHPWRAGEVEEARAAHDERDGQARLPGRAPALPGPQAPDDADGKAHEEQARGHEEAGPPAGGDEGHGKAGIVAASWMCADRCCPVGEHARWKSVDSVDKSI
jgi:hypothetical protein